MFLFPSSESLQACVLSYQRWHSQTFGLASPFTYMNLPRLQSSRCT